jgi:hypothetical protein
VNDARHHRANRKRDLTVQDFGVPKRAGHLDAGLRNHDVPNESTVNNESDQASICLDWLWKAAMRRHKRAFSHLRMREKL